MANDGARAQDAPACAQWRDGPRAEVVDVVDGDVLLLDSGARARLIGIQAPKLAQGREGFDDWPLADEARQALMDLVADGAVQFHYAGARKDRYGRLLVHGVNAKGQWLQHEMVAKGLARVYSLADNRNCLDALFQAEAVARAERIGIWKDPFYAIRNAHRPADIVALEGRFELVEGAVRDVGTGSGRTYLNFGADWDQDFTVVIEARARRLFEAEGLDLDGLAGALVRVRGWIDIYGGPRIMVTHPEQIEVLAR